MKLMNIAVLFLFFFTITGCGASEWETTITVGDTFHANRQLPLTLEVKENGERVKGLEVTAALEMKHMDHGSVEVLFQEQEDGTYLGLGDFPMAGEWEALVEISNNQKVVEQIIPLTIKE